MRILGINSGLHDASACVVIDGRIVSCAAEERFTRKKHDGSYPIEAIRLCLKQANLSFDDIDTVAYGWDYFKHEWKKLQYHIDKTLQIADQSPAEAIAYLTNLRDRKASSYNAFGEVEQQHKQYFGVDLINVDHHIAHAFSSFPLSGFDSSAVLVIDGNGEQMTSSLWHHKDRSLRFLKSYDLPDSLGTFYGAITQFLGFMHLDEEWKVMGWAGYGQPRFYPIMKEILSSETLKLNLEYFQFQLGKFPWFSAKLSRALNLPPRHDDDDFHQVYADVAASAQKLLEECILTLAREIKELTKEQRLCMAGGVSLNGLANGRVLEADIFKNIFVPPAPSDDGIALGAALRIASQRGANIFHRMDAGYFGSSFEAADYLNVLQENEIPFAELSDCELYHTIAKQLSCGKIVAWFQGKSEIGPRALGNRSILADPRNPNMKEILNRKIKFREPFRPFAPSVLEEYAAEYFAGDLAHATFMNQIFKVKKQVQSHIPAVTHVDETARIQVVKRSANPRYYDLIKTFYRLTGVPVLVNTSFNVKEEPIVDSPQQAVNCFLKTGLDILVLGNYVATKHKSTLSLLSERHSSMNGVSSEA